MLVYACKIGVFRASRMVLFSQDDGARRRERSAVNNHPDGIVS